MRELVKLLAERDPVKFDELIALSREHGLFERIIGTDGDLETGRKIELRQTLKAV